MIRVYTLLFLICFTGFTACIAGNPDFEARRTAYIDYALNNVNSDALSIQAAKGVPVNQQELTTILNNVSTRSTADFDIVKLVRILMFSNGEYDSPSSLLAGS